MHPWITDLIGREHRGLLMQEAKRDRLARSARVGRVPRRAHRLAAMIGNRPGFGLARSASRRLGTD